MTKRLYFMLPDAQICYHVVTELKEANIPERHMHAIADAGQSLEGLPKASTLQKSELLYGLEAGLGVGGAAGLLGGLLTITFPPAGLALGGGAILATALAGAGFGALVSGLVANDIPNHKVQAFEKEIYEGKILLIVDVPRKKTVVFINMIRAHYPEVEISVSEPVKH
jgi:hypothetical protein